VKRLLTVFSLCATLVLALALAVAPGAGAAPGGVFITGHDPDFHAQAGNVVGARNIIRRAVEFVTSNNPSPSMLVVSSRIPVPPGHLDSVTGMTVTGYSGFAVAAAPGQGVLDLNTVDFSNYDVIVVVSDFGGLLRQAELNILNARSSDLIDYVNDGGGLVALAESNGGSHLTPAGGHYDFLPFLASETPIDQVEAGNTVTPFGASMGLVASDVNGNVSHNIFTAAGGFQVVDTDSQGRILSLAIRGVQVCQGGVPSITVDDVSRLEGASGSLTPFVFTVLLSISPCGADTTVNYATADGTAQAGSDYSTTAGTLTFTEGETSKTVSVPVVGDNVFEDDETFFLNLSGVTNGTVADGQGLGTILNDDPRNQSPDCSNVTADPDTLWSPNHHLRLVTLTGGTDPDGDTVAITITGVTQDEPVSGPPGNTAPDAAPGFSSYTVQLRAERDGGSDGRVYRIAFRCDDGNGGTSTGQVVVGVPHDHRPGSVAVDSGGSFDSFTA
jgi:hypothetical protein